MKKSTNYIKASSYEAKIGDVKNALLLYSGGLDTSVMIKWLHDTYHVDVTTLTMDLGQQHDDLEKVKAKALALGAKEAIVLDVKDDFANGYIAKGILANASYQGDYHLSTPIARAVTAAKAVEVAKSLGIQAIAHGCTGKGNDQVRLEGYMLTLEPAIKIIAPVREWNMDRNDEIHYAMKHGIPVPVTLDFPYSVDDNMWGMTWEGGEIEDPTLIAPVAKFLTTYTLPNHAPDTAQLVRLTFDRGQPVALNGRKMKLAALIQALNVIAGAHGVGIAHLVEDRLVGLKNGGVYELPAAHVIISAHSALEKLVQTRDLNQLKAEMDIKWGYFCYGAKWFDPVMGAINASNAWINQKVCGEVTIELYKGKATVVALVSPFALANTSFNVGEGYSYNVNASAGFIEVYTLQMKLANQIHFQ